MPNSWQSSAMLSPRSSRRRLDLGATGRHGAELLFSRWLTTLQLRDIGIKHPLHWCHCARLAYVRESAVDKKASAGYVGGTLATVALVP